MAPLTELTSLSVVGSVCEPAPWGVSPITIWLAAKGTAPCRSASNARPSALNFASTVPGAESLTTMVEVLSDRRIGSPRPMITLSGWATVSGASRT